MKNFQDIEQFPFLKPFIENRNLIIEEFIKAKNSFKILSDFISSNDPELFSHSYHWLNDQGLTPESGGYDARDKVWAAFPIYKRGFPFNWYEPKKHFPMICDLLEKVPNVYFSAFFREGVNSGALEHTHNTSRFIFHLCLTEHEEGKCILTVNNETKSFTKETRYLIFDYSKPHSSFNYDTKDRINFIIDFDF